MPKPKRTVKALLQEALDTIKATYWVQKNEYIGVDLNEDEKPHATVVKLSEDSGLIPDDLRDFAYRDDDEKLTAEVTFVCSIGAISLATAVLYDVPLLPFHKLTEIDPISKAAGIALAQAIVELHPEHIYNHHDFTGLIVEWNDHEETERHHVLKVFRHAIAHPLVSASKIWGLSQVGGGRVVTPIAFATKREASLFCKALDRLREPFSEWAGTHDAWDIDEVKKFARKHKVPVYLPVIGFGCGWNLEPVHVADVKDVS